VKNKRGISMIKTKSEIEKIKISSQMVAKTLEMVGHHIKPGISTDEINHICHEYITKNLEATPACLNYKGFPKSICTSVNHVVCHGIPGPKILKSGDIINVDITIENDGYHGDSAKMFFVGKPSVLASRLVKVTQECLQLGIAQAKPGNTLGDIGHAIQTHAEKNNFSVVEEYCGHGIGKTLHEEPQVLHYGKPGQGKVIKEGMVFTIEPMINAGKKYNKLLADGWTVVTKDKSLSAQWEHTLAITKDGAEILTKRKEENT